MWPIGSTPAGPDGAARPKQSLGQRSASWWSIVKSKKSPSRVHAHVDQLVNLGISLGDRVIFGRKFHSRPKLQGMG